MRSRMWITTTALCLVTLFVALFAGTAQAMVTDITGISASVPENTTAAGTAVASGGAGPYSFALACTAPGADDGLFSITLAGVLKFNAAPNFEAPADVGGNNMYDICVQATDIGDNPDTYFDKNFTITVTDVAVEPPLAITVNGENIALAHPGDPATYDYYGVAVGYQLVGADVTAANVRQVTVELKDAGGNTLHSMVTSSPAKATANQASGGQYTAPFAVKIGSKVSSSTWGATYTDQWGAVPGTPAASAVVTLEDINHTLYTATINGLSGDPSDSWEGLFPEFKYTAGTGGTITGTNPQKHSWYGPGSSGSAVLAVPNTGYHFVDWSDAVTSALRTDEVGSAVITSTPPYSGVDVTANFAPTDITVTGQNIALAHPGDPATFDYYGVAVGYRLQGADATAANIVSATVVLKDAGGNTLHTMVTSSAAKATANQGGCGANCGDYTAPFAVKIGSKTSSSTWGSSYTDQWGAVPGTPAASAVVTVLDKWGVSHTATITGLSGDPSDSWAGLFPLFKYTAGAGGTLTGTASQRVAWYGTGATGSAVTAVPTAGNYFSGWSDAVATAARTDSVGTASITTTPPYSGIDVTANFATPDIHVNGENIALVKTGHTDYFGVAVGYNLSGADVIPANIVSAKVELKDAGGNILHTMNTTASNQPIQYTAPFAVKMGTKTTSTTWGSSYTDQWSEGFAAPNKPAVSAVVTVMDKWGFSHTATITGLSGEAVDVAAGWTGLFPEFKYNAGAGGTLTGTASQKVAWYGSGATGSEVTAVPNTGNYFSGWSDAIATAARTDTVPVSANIASYSGVDVTASFTSPLSITGTIVHSGLLAGGTTIMFDTATTDYPGTITLSTGDYTIPGIPYGAVGDIVPAYYGGSGYTFSPTTIHVTVTGSLTGQNFTASGARTISGTITGPSGARLPVGAVVDFGNGLTFTQGAGTTTGFSFTGLPPKNYRLGLLSITYPGTEPFLNDKLYLAVSPMPSKPPTTSPAFNFASTVYGDDTVGNDLMYFWEPFTLTGSIKTPAGVNPYLKAFNISLVGTGDFAGQTLTGTYKSSDASFTINTPFTKIGSTITPAAFTGNLMITGTGYQTFTPLGSYTMNASKIAPNVTAYGDRAIYGQFTAGLIPPDGTVIDFGGGLTSTVEDGGWFYLPNLERKSYTLKPIAEGYYFTTSASSTTQASITANLSSANSDLSGKFYGKAAPILTTPLNASDQNAANVIFNWSAPSGAPAGVKYKVQYATNSTFSSGLVTSSFIDVTTYLPASFVNNSPDKTYYWRVTAYDSAGKVLGTSIAWTFTR